MALYAILLFLVSLRIVKYFLDQEATEDEQDNLMLRAKDDLKSSILAGNLYEAGLHPSTHC